MSPGVHSHVHPWSLTIPVTIVLILIALVYLRGWFRNRIPAWRMAAFLGGLFSIWIAVGSPLVVLDHQLLTMHMVKHLLLMAVASPLILLGMAVRWPIRGLKRCALCWLAGTATVVGWHLPAAFQLALTSPVWHGLEDATFLLAGLLFWWPVVQARPSGAHPWSMPIYLFMATLPCDILSAFLAFCGRVVYPSYLTSPRLFGLSPLDDQEFAGALMWVSITFIYLVPAIVITMQILSPGVRADVKALRT